MEKQANKKKDSKLLPLLGVLILVVAVGGWYLYSTVYTPTTPQEIVEKETKLPIKNTAKWDNEIFSNQAYLEKEDIRTLPIEVGDHTNPNPFVQIQQGLERQ